MKTAWVDESLCVINDDEIIWSMKSPSVEQIDKARKTVTKFYESDNYIMIGELDKIKYTNS